MRTGVALPSHVWMDQGTGALCIVPSGPVLWATVREKWGLRSAEVITGVHEHLATWYRKQRTRSDQWPIQLSITSPTVAGMDALERSSNQIYLAWSIPYSLPSLASTRKENLSLRPFLTQLCWPNQSTLRLLGWRGCQSKSPSLTEIQVNNMDTWIKMVASTDSWYLKNIKLARQVL